MAKLPSAFILKSNGTINYTTGEREFFKLIPRSGKITSAEIAEKKWPKGTMPFHGRKSVIGAMTNLIEKTNRNKEPFRILKTKRRGPHPMEFWLEER
jgi:hypothetical protein